MLSLIVLLGDFNSQARDKDAVINEMFRLKDVGNAAFKAGDPENTFDSRNPTQRIDYIFYTKKSIKYIGGKVLNTKPWTSLSKIDTLASCDTYFCKYSSNTFLTLAAECGLVEI